MVFFRNFNADFLCGFLVPRLRYKAFQHLALVIDARYT